MMPYTADDYSTHKQNQNAEDTIAAFFSRTKWGVSGGKRLDREKGVGEKDR